MRTEVIDLQKANWYLCHGFGRCNAKAMTIEEVAHWKFIISIFPSKGSICIICLKFPFWMARILVLSQCPVTCPVANLKVD